LWEGKEKRDSSPSYILQKKRDGKEKVIALQDDSTFRRGEEQLRCRPHAFSFNLEEGGTANTEGKERMLAQSIKTTLRERKRKRGFIFLKGKEEGELGRGEGTLTSR